MEEIRIESRVTSVRKVYDLLAASSAGSVKIEMRSDKGSDRGVDPTVLVAIVGAASTSLGALLSGLFGILMQARSNKIVIQTKDGGKIEIPANYSPQQVSDVIGKLQESSVSRIVLDR